MARPGREPTGRPPGRPKGRKPIPWVAIEDAFVQGLERRVDGRPEHYWPSLHELMNQFPPVGFRTLQEASRKRGWVEKKKAFKSRVDAEYASKLAENLAGARRELEAERIQTATSVVRAMRTVAREQYFPDVDAAERTENAAKRLRGPTEESPSVELRNLGAAARALLDGMIPVPASSLPTPGAGSADKKAAPLDPAIEKLVDDVVEQAFAANESPPDDKRGSED